jgi:L-threonylcarbamoyladenylate synthase
MRRVFVDSEAPQRDAIQEAAKWIRIGGLLAIPTDTLYGLAGDPFNRQAVARIFAVKGRGAERALPLIAASLPQVVAHFGPLEPAAARLAECFWPGPLTLLLPAPASLASGVTGGTGRVGVRVPADRVARDICQAADRPITATSANRSGAPPTADPDEVERVLGADLDLLVDAGPTPGGPPSTIVDVSERGITLIREGAIPWERLSGLA